ncbi:olfactory receptor 5AR1-like [Discoglossus pictus]
MKNQTEWSEFLLSGFSDHPDFQLHIFLFFLLIYMMTLIGNILILLLILSDVHLQTPMYFFLGNLACLDVCCSSVTAPKMLTDLHTQRWRISRSACITQILFFISFISSEAILLAVMSCDRYFAICRPLHYMQLMHWKTCVQLASGVWALGMVYSLVHTLCTLRLSFCDSNTIHSFFCDLPQLLQLSCSDTLINILVIFLMGSFLAISTSAITFGPYISIFTTMLKIQAKSSRLKAFSTCTSHITVVFIFYGTLLFNYFRPNTNYHYAGDKLVSVCYTVMIPILNPMIYSLRNQDLRAALRRALHKINMDTRIIHNTNKT